jgi:hypothetical protein
MINGVDSNYRTIIKNLELFLKTRIFLKKKTYNNAYFEIFYGFVLKKP